MAKLKKRNSLNCDNPKRSRIMKKVPSVTNAMKAVLMVENFI